MSKTGWLLLAVVAVVIVGGGGVGLSEVIVRKIAEAIAFAEGYYVAGSVPSRLNNPGDLTVDITGRAIGQQGIYQVYSSAQDGWEALYTQVRLMFAGSHIYNPLMTIAEIASHYTTTQQAEWAANVARRLGVSINTRLSEIA